MGSSWDSNPRPSEYQSDTLTIKRASAKFLQVVLTLLELKIEIIAQLIDVIS